MTEYRIISGASAKSLEEQVNDLLQEGWQLQGGVSITTAGSRTVESYLRGGGTINQIEILFSQAMIGVHND